MINQLTLTEYTGQKLEYGKYLVVRDEKSILKYIMELVGHIIIIQSLIFTYLRSNDR